MELRKLCVSINLMVRKTSAKLTKIIESEKFAFAGLAGFKVQWGGFALRLATGYAVFALL